MPNDKEMTVTLGAATSSLVRSLFEESKVRAEKETRYTKTAETFVEILLDYAIRRKTNEYKNDDKREVGRVLREALDKVVNGKPLNAEETKLVAVFKAASQPGIPVAAAPAA